MKPFYEQINNLPDKSYFLRSNTGSYLTMDYHYHPELELSYNYGNMGKRFIGNSVERIEESDLVFLGKNLPHRIVSDKEFEHHKNRDKAQSILLQFKYEIFESSFSKLPEMESLGMLIEKSKRGLCIFGKTRERIVQKLNNLLESDGMNSIIIILEIMKELSTTKEYRLLSSSGFVKEYHTPDYHRMNVIYDYIIQNFKEEIKLEDVAKVANLTETAFCRFFKKRTLKTMTQVVKELRVSYACSLLKMDVDDVSVICEKTGFKNLSNFNRQFKKQTGLTPLSYRKEFKT